MKTINIQIKGVKVDNFKPVDKTVKVFLKYLMNNEKVFEQTVVIDYPELIAHKMLLGLRKEIKRNYKETMSEKDMLASLNIYLDKEDDVEENLAFFFSNLKSKIDSVKKAQVADGYLSMLSAINGMESKL